MCQSLEDKLMKDYKFELFETIYKWMLNLKFPCRVCPYLMVSFLFNDANVLYLFSVLVKPLS